VKNGSLRKVDGRFKIMFQDIIVPHGEILQARSLLDKRMVINLCFIFSANFASVVFVICLCS
jgi:hypothetical protein